MLKKVLHSGPDLLRSVVFIGLEFAITNIHLVFTGVVQPAGSLHSDRFLSPGRARQQISIQPSVKRVALSIAEVSQKRDCLLLQ